MEGEHVLLNLQGGPPPPPPTTRPMEGREDDDLDERAVQQAAEELLHAAGRPELLIQELTEYEREAWRSIARRTVRAYWRGCQG